MKYSFFNDYSEGAHPRILEALVANNGGQELGYGDDSFTAQAKALLKQQCAADPDIYFLTGGTQTNLLAIAAMLKPWESVISAESGHIAVHEAGAIEATGHKVNTIKTRDGKLTPELIDPVVEEHKMPHMVLPHAVFIANATEVGTVYSKNEIQALSDYCHSHNLLLYLDGARLGTVLCDPSNDLKLADLATLTDMFYIGGTKNGALFGEAVIVNNQELKKNFFRNIKQHGALLPKGRAVSIQFLELFKDGLFKDLAAHANSMAQKLSLGIKELGLEFLTSSTTNQIFPILNIEQIATLEKEYGFYVWEKVDDTKSAIRLVTSWATPDSAIDIFLADLRQII